MRISCQKCAKQRALVIVHYSSLPLHAPAIIHSLLIIHKPSARLFGMFSLHVATCQCTVLVLSMAHRIWKETEQQPGTAGPGTMLGCCLNSFHFLWAILSTSTLLSGVNLWVHVWLRGAQTERGNARGGAIKKHDFSRTSSPTNLHF